MTYSSRYFSVLDYTKLLAAHVNQGRHLKALALFRHIHRARSLSLDAFVFPLAIKSSAHLRHARLGTSIHALTFKFSLSYDSFVSSSLIDMYGKCVSTSLARQLFDEIPQRNAVVWNSMISLYADSGNVQSALELFRIMDVLPSESSFNSIIIGLLEVEEGVLKAIEFYRGMLKQGLKPNMVTVLALVKACLGMSVLSWVKEIHAFSIRINVDSDLKVGTRLVEAYGKCGCLDRALMVFWNMRERDTVAWTSLIAAYTLQGKASIALEMFSKMEEDKIKPDGSTFLSVLKACSHAGLDDEARMYFLYMQNQYSVKADSNHYACLVDSLSWAGRLHEAYEVIKGMPVQVTAKAWGTLLGACRTYGEVELGEIAGQALFQLEPQNPANYVILARLYESAGQPESVQRLMTEMEERGLKATLGSSQTAHQSALHVILGLLAWLKNEGTFSALVEGIWIVVFEHKPEDTFLMPKIPCFLQIEQWNPKIYTQM